MLHVYMYIYIHCIYYIIIISSLSLFSSLSFLHAHMHHLAHRGHADATIHDFHALIGAGDPESEAAVSSADSSAAAVTAAEELQEQGVAAADMAPNCGCAGEIIDGTTNGYLRTGAIIISVFVCVATI